MEDDDYLMNLLNPSKEILLNDNDDSSEDEDQYLKPKIKLLMMMIDEHKTGVNVKC